MFRKDNWFKTGWCYFVVMFILEMILPEWTGEENGVIENLQLLWLLAGFYYCWEMRGAQLAGWGGNPQALWRAGMIYFFLLIMREISWGRTFFIMPDGRMIEYSQMGLYGKMVHPLVGILILLAFWFCYRAKIWRMLLLVKLPAKSFALLLLFILLTWIAEKQDFTGFHGEVCEELAEFGAYMMMHYLLRDMGSRLKK